MSDSAARNALPTARIATRFDIDMVMLVSSRRREMRSAGGEMSECPARARTVAYMDISISLGRPSGKWLILAHGVQMPDAVVTDEARDPGDVALLSTVGVLLETKDISDLSVELHGGLQRKDIAIFVPWRAMRVRAARSLVRKVYIRTKRNVKGIQDLLAELAQGRYYATPVA
jgi:hypothetical protein